MHQSTKAPSTLSPGDSNVLEHVPATWTNVPTILWHMGLLGDVRFLGVVCALERLVAANKLEQSSRVSEAMYRRIKEK